MKIFDLLNSLTDEEKKVLKRGLYIPNKLLKEIFADIIEISEADFLSQKTKLFRKYYGQVINVQSEKKFKNHLSELYDLIRNYVAQLWLQDTDHIELNKIVNYINVLGRRQCNELFDKEWNYWYQQFYETNYYFGLGKLYFEKYSQTIRTPKLFLEAIEYLKTAYRYDYMAYKEDVTSISYTALNLNYFHDLYGIEDNISSQTFQDLRSEVESQFENPLDIAIQLIEEKDELNKWKLVVTICDLLKEKKRTMRKGIQFKLGQSIFNYAIVLVVDEKLEKAEWIFNFIDQNQLIDSVVANSSVFYFNYSTLLLKLEKLKSAMDYHNRVMANMGHIPLSRKTQYLIREKYLQILNKDYTDIYSDLSHLQEHLFKEDQHLYVRALIIFYLIDTKDLESAARECENAKRTKYFKSDLASDEAEVIKYIHKLILIQLKETISAKKFGKIKLELLSSRLFTSTSHLLKIWLKSYVEELETML